MSGAAPAGTAPRATLPSHKVRYRQGELGSLCSSDARALQGKRVRVLGSKDRPSCKRSEAPLGYLQRSIGSSRGWFALKDSRILRQRFRGVLREQDRLCPRRHCPRPRRHCRLPPSGVSADSSSHGHAEGNLLRRAPLTHHVVCSKVVRVRLSSGLSDPGLRGRFTPFPHSPLQPISSRRCSSRIAKEICRLSCSQAWWT